MYRLLTLLIILTIVDQSLGYHRKHRNIRFHPHPRRHNYHEPYEAGEENIYDFLHGLEKGLPNFDFQMNCNDPTRAIPTIVYGVENCVFKYAVPMTADFNIDVSIRGGTLRLSVIVVTDGGIFSLTDSRILPDILDFDRAVWSIKRGLLSVTLPYKVPLGTEFNPICNTVDNEIVVPYVETPEEPLFQYR